MLSKRRRPRCIRKHRGRSRPRAQEDAGVPEGTPRSQYYPFYIWARSGGDTLIQSTSTEQSELTTYATKFSESGEIGFLLVNQGANAKQIELVVTGASLLGKANAWILSGSDLFDDEFLFNGAAGPGPYSGPDPREPEAAPYSTSFSGGTVTITVPAYSFTGVTLH